MRIALVSPYDLDVPGGVQQHVEHLGLALQAHGHEVHLIAPGRAKADPDSPDAEPTGVPRLLVGASTRVPFNDSVAPLALAPRSALRTVLRLEELQPDVVHVHEPVVPWVSLAATLRGPRPVVGTFHAWSDRDRAYGASRKLTSRIVSRLDAWVAVSEAAQHYHSGALQLPAGRFRIVPNGVDVARFRDAEPFEQQRDPERPIVLFVGRLEARKGLHVAIRAFVQLKTRHPRARLVVIGDGPEREASQSMVPTALRPDVEFLGRVPSDDIPRWFRTADVYASPALGGESFGIVLLEAMAAGVPIVASDIPGYRSSMTDGVTGRLVPPRDPSALVDALDAMLSSPDLRRSFINAGHDRVARFDWDVVARELLDVYGAAVLRDHARRSGADSLGDSGRAPS